MTWSGAGARRQNHLNETRRSHPPALFASSPTDALPVAPLPINPLIYIRVFSSLTGPPPRTLYPLLAQAGVNHPSLPITESSLISSQRYVKTKSLVALTKQLTRSQIALLESLPVIRSPCHPPAPPLHHFLDHRLACRWQIIVARFGRNKSNQVDVCLPYATPRNGCRLT